MRVGREAVIAGAGACPACGRGPAGVAGAARTADGARRFAENVGPVIREIRATSVANLRGIAAVLNARGMRTAHGSRCANTQVGAVLARAAQASHGARGTGITHPERPPFEDTP